MAASRVSRFWTNQSPKVRSLLRIASAFTFMLAGSSKLFAFPVGMPNGMKLVPFSEVWFAGVLEVFGGGLLVLGLCTRPVAFVLSGEMAVAYFQAHFPHSPWPTVNGGVPAFLYCFLWLYFSSAGAGPLSIDALRGK